MPVDVLTRPIEHDVPLVVLSPHLDDAALSCGAVMIYAASRTAVTVITLFTEAGQPPHTLSARRYLKQVGARDAQSLYRRRRAEDRAALESIGITCVHAGLPEALFRRRPQRRLWAPFARLLPELTHIYPVYRRHITAGRIAAADAGTLHDVCDIVTRAAGSGPSVVLAPLAVGSHVDHVLVRTAAECSGAQVVYYSDFPYNRRHLPDGAFLRRNGLVETQWPLQVEEKADLIRAYETQVGALFKGGHIPPAPEVFFYAPSPGGSSSGGTNDLARTRNQ
jgi:LmbE family N-acetylglucosaminyl deacetylase